MAGPLNCCEGSAWVYELDLDSAHGFEFSLGKCDKCGKPWMAVFCGASSVSNYEKVTPEDAVRMKAVKPNEIKAFMRQWSAFLE